MGAARGLRTGMAAAIAAAVVTAMVPTAQASAAGAAAAKPSRADRPWSGFAIHANRTADGHWIGARKLNKEVVYRLDPARKAKRSSYGPVRPVGNLAGRQASRRDTVRAAYILSRYGTFRYDVQSAAVDIALDHLLVGGRYRLSGDVTSRRVQQTGEAAKVRSFAKAMLKESRRQAGPPKMAVSVTNAAVGGTVRATVRVRGANGRPVKDAPVTLSYPGATTQAARTDQAGTAVATFVATSAGRHAVVATVKDLPEWRLHLRSPKRAKVSRVARAGVKGRASASAVATINVRPTVQITSPAQAMRTSPIPGRFTLSGGEPGTRSATIRLFGPFTTAAGTTCAAKQVVARSMTVTGNGTYNMPAVTAPSAGFYTWSVAVAADSVNQSVAACGGAIAVKVQPAVAVQEEAGNTLKSGALLPSTVTTRGLPSGLPYAGHATVRVYGPFVARDNVRCLDAKLRKRTTGRVNGNGTVRAEPVELNARGYYGLTVVLPAGTFSTAATSSCRAANTVVRVE